MFRIVNRLIALSLGVQREQLEQRIGFTWPRPFLLRPLEARFLTMIAKGKAGGALGSENQVVCLLLLEDCEVER